MGEKYLLLKRGLFWRPNSQGYTALKSEAGRYSEEEALSRIHDGSPPTITVLEKNAPSIAPGCKDITALHRHISALEARCERYREALKSLVEAKALSGVRDQVAGWNGENKADGPYSPHPRRLGAVLPKTNCGAIYDLDDALEKARAALSEEAGSDGT